MPDKHKWHITNFKPIRKGSVAGSFSFETPHFTINSCLYFKRDGNHWVGWPSRQYEDQQGGTAYSILIEPAPHLKKRMSDWILAEIKKLEPVEPDQPRQEVLDNPDEDIPF